MSAHEPSDTMIEALRRANPVPAAEAEGRRSLPSRTHSSPRSWRNRGDGSEAGRGVACIVLIAIVLLALLVAGS